MIALCVGFVFMPSSFGFFSVGFVRLPPLLLLHINFLWCKSISPGYGSQYGYLLKCLYIIAFFTSAKSANVSYICFSFRSISFTLWTSCTKAYLSLLTASACALMVLLKSLMRINGITEPVRN